MVDLKGLLNGPARRALSGSGILACAATGVDRAVLQLNGDVEKLFASVGIHYRDIHNPTTSIALSAFCQLYTNVAKELEQPSFGLNVGANYQPIDLGILGYLAANAPSLQMSLHCLTAYFESLQQGTLFRLATYRGKPALEYQIIDPSVRARSQDAELSLAMFFNFMQLYFGAQSCVDEVQFQHSLSSDGVVYEQFFNAETRFNAETNRIIFDEQLLGLHNPAADADLFCMLHSLFQSSRTEPTEAEPDLLDSIRQCIAASLEHGDITLNQIADTLALPSWTLQRKLAERGYTFSSLIEDVRQHLALHYLASQTYNITQVALMLGYSEVSAFSRAFKRWTGYSPLRYNQQRGL